MTNRLDRTRARLSPDVAGIAAAIVVAVAIGASLVGRAGYGPDEEITLFAVEGIKAHGIPVLPSGLAYFRGPSYSYLAWLTGLAGGDGFEAYRWLGVLCLAGVIVAAAQLARSLFDRGSATAWLIALAPAAVAAGAYARFYMPFAAVCTLTLIAATRMRDDPRQRAWFVAGCVAARSVHEFGMLLAIVPAAGWLCAGSSDERRTFTWLTVITGTVLLAEHTLILWLPCILWSCQGATWGFSSSGIPSFTSSAAPIAAFASPAEIAVGVVIAGTASVAGHRKIRADVLFTIATAVAAALFANGVVAALVVLWALARPSDAAKTARAGLLAAAAGTVGWIALIAVRGNALVDARMVEGLLRTSFTFPWGGILQLATQEPLLVAAVVAGIWRSAFARAARHPIAARTLAVLLYLELLSFGATGTDVRSRFLVLLMPLGAVFAGAAIHWFAESAGQLLGRGSRSLTHAAAGAIAIVVVGSVSIEQAFAIIPHRDPDPAAPWITKWLPPVALSSLDLERAIVKPNDVIVTNDELAATSLLGRIDYWWPPDSESAARYSFLDERGQAKGLYGGAPVITDSQQLERVIQSRDTRGIVVALFNTGKFGFDPSTLRGLIDANNTVELDERAHDWFIARFPPRR